ncbi:right-handed parallel beta-helix repeat-containing protein [Wenyingzhuangia sp. IMCC45574]
MKFAATFFIFLFTLLACEKNTTAIESTTEEQKTGTTSTTKTILKVSEQTGGNNYEKLLDAVNKANSSNEILVDVHIDFDSNAKAIVIDKPNTTIKGDLRDNYKLKFTRTAPHKSKNHILNSLIVVKTNNVVIENLQLLINDGQGYRAAFIGSINQNGSINSRTTLYKNITFKDCAMKQKSITDTTRGLFFEGSFENITIDNCFFNNWFGLVARDCPILRNFSVNANKFYNGSHQVSFDGALLDENDPTYGIGESLIEHSNISFTKNKFYLTKSFNIALAYTKNVLIDDNYFAGGTETGYSQPIHIEDRSKNITITNNQINNPADSGILVFSTGKVGHGQGRSFTEAEKKAKGSGNIIIKNNDITTRDIAVTSAYLNGTITFEGNNTINTEVTKAVNIVNVNSGAKTILKDNNSRFNGFNRNQAIANGNFVSTAQIVKQ